MTILRERLAALVEEYRQDADYTSWQPSALIARVFVRRLEALLAEPDDDGWQPIETAPRGELVLLYCPHLHFSNPERVEIGYADNGNGSHHAWGTHWRPLPLPPEPRSFGTILAALQQEPDEAAVERADGAYCKAITEAFGGSDETLIVDARRAAMRAALIAARQR